MSQMGQNENTGRVGRGRVGELTDDVAESPLS